MTAADILQRWRRVRPVLNQSSMWFTLLTIAEAGEDGIGRHDLAAKTGARPCSLTHSVKRLRVSGLIEERRGPQPHRGKPALLSIITAKGYEFLAVKPSKKKTA